MYIKNENGEIVNAPNPLKLGDTVIFNPTAEHLTEAGYEVCEPPVMVSDEDIIEEAETDITLEESEEKHGES